MTMAAAVPESGQLVEVRRRQWVVTDIEQSSLTDGSVSRKQHLVTMVSLDEDSLNESLLAVWELEPGARVLETAGLPSVAGWDSCERLEAFLDAVRWGASTNADRAFLQAPFRSGVEIQDFQLDPLVRAIDMARANLLIADDVGLGKVLYERRRTGVSNNHSQSRVWRRRYVSEGLVRGLCIEPHLYARRAISRARGKSVVLNRRRHAHGEEAEERAAARMMRSKLSVPLASTSTKWRAEAMKERPILFSGEMVRAILNGRKTQTRRVMKPQPSLTPSGLMNWKGSIIGEVPHESGDFTRYDEVTPRCPYGKPGDRLWVREKFQYVTDWTGIRTGNILYATTMSDKQGYGWGADTCVVWKPSIHMPRWASRITLEVVSVRVELVQDISEDDAKAEGVLPVHCNGGDGATHVGGFYFLWGEINEKRGYGWDTNPWVWVVEFRRQREGNR